MKKKHFDRCKSNQAGIKIYVCDIILLYVHRDIIIFYLASIKSNV